jgi:hypothetical protein
MSSTADTEPGGELGCENKRVALGNRPLALRVPIIVDAELLEEGRIWVLLTRREPVHARGIEHSLPQEDRTRPGTSLSALPRTSRPLTSN